jgi:hypothetical protein
VSAGFVCLPAFVGDPYLNPLKQDGRWNELLKRIKARQQAAIDVFAGAGGRTLIGS